MPLPYGYTTLRPALSTATVSAHYDRHYLGYIKRLNEMVGTYVTSVPEALRLAERVGRGPADGLLATAARPEWAAAQAMCDPGELWDQASQAYAHEAYFAGMRPFSPILNMPPSVARALEATFGTVSAARQALVDHCTRLFGSGWVWLVRSPKGAIEYRAVSNARLPTELPLGVIDVWEHAYYLDYLNARRRYAEAWWDCLCDWDAVAGRLQRASA
jgi:Fe-Mn family superoxide dismutase